MLKIAVFASGGGTDFQSIIDAVKSGELDAEIAYLVAGKPGIYAIQRAMDNGIPYGIYAKNDYPSINALCLELARVLTEKGIDLIVLAGYLNIITEELIKPFENRIINIHPSLIPKHSGAGYYGMKVHESVIKSGDKKSGATVHYVNEIPDGGAIIMQTEVDVLPGDTAETLAKRVLEAEHKLLPEAVAFVLKNIENNK